MYTVGQRRGLGISHPEPLYVLRLDAGRNVLVVGTEDRLYASTLECRVAWIDRGQTAAPGLSAKIRSRSPWAAVESVAVRDGTARVRFAAPQRAIAPGQTVALYRGDVVVGSGIIERAGE
jgi:tRNA-specific 2-thiouridylase